MHALLILVDCTTAGHPAPKKLRFHRDPYGVCAVKVVPNSKPPLPAGRSLVLTSVGADALRKPTETDQVDARWKLS